MPNPIELFAELGVFAKLTIAVAVVAFGLAVAYAWRPTEQKLTLMRPVSLATIFTTLSGLLGGWIAVLGSVAAAPDGHPPAAMVYRGLAESLTIGFVTFGLLGAAWILVAVGVLRRDGADAAP